MGKGIMITATGTDVGKTYITALLAKAMKAYGFHVGYYKAALSGAGTIAASDAGYVNDAARLDQEENSLLSYLYRNAVSPHLAAKWEGNPVDLTKVRRDYERVGKEYDYVLVEGSGGIVCPLRYDDGAHIFLEDIIQTLSLKTLIVADAGLGAINAVTLTAEYLKNRKLDCPGVILNRFTKTPMEMDNAAMITTITGLPVLALVAPGAKDLAIGEKTIRSLFEER